MAEIEVHETHVEVVARAEHARAADPDAEAYLWVCACGEGDEELARDDAYLEARRHTRIAG